MHSIARGGSSCSKVTRFGARGPVPKGNVGGSSKLPSADVPAAQTPAFAGQISLGSTRRTRSSLSLVIVRVISRMD